MKEQVLCIVFRKKENNVEFLLLKRYPIKGNFWQPPCGSKENFDKTLLDAAFRELHEETGIKKKDILQIQSDIDHYTIKRHYITLKQIEPIHELVYLFQVSANVKIDINKNQDKEHTTWSWVNYKDAMELLYWQENKNALKKAYHFIENFA